MAMPNPFQKLKHGVLLCKKNFNTFVETFNFLVDFAQNIKGDGDANENGTIVFDRTVPDRPVIRSKINMAYPFAASSADIPWMFSCTVDPDTQERSGGWYNGRLQLGYDCNWGTPDVQNDINYQIADIDKTEDGYHAIEINLNNRTVKVVVSRTNPGSDNEHGIIRIMIGYVNNAVLIYGCHMNPVCYTLL